MNILLAASSHDGPSWVAFKLESLNWQLEHHKNLYDAVLFCLNDKEKRGNTEFGKIFSVCYGALYEDRLFAEYMLKAECEFADHDRPESKMGYTNITIKPPFRIDAVINLTTFG